MTHWSFDAVFYHIYPLGFCGAPAQNDFTSPAVARLDKIYPWLDHIQGLGVNALYLGPLFESSRHGYDTADYYAVDRRLGTNETLAAFSQELHRRGMRLILDGVFNHVGRDFWAFRDVQRYRDGSAYRDWFANLRFDGGSRYGDPFTYTGWNGHESLVKLNLDHPDARRHLFDAVRTWVEAFGIDGLRLDAADAIDLGFLGDLATHCRGLRSDFWLMGEVIHGDYRRWANPNTLDSVTNYEVYKSLYSSHADRNYFELAYALNRQFGPDGLYRGLPLYTFADNHDVNRVASNLKDPAHLFPLHGLLFSMPGTPSIYYGSEWGLPGERTTSSDTALRPALDLAALLHSSPQPELAAVIAKLAQVRRETPALRYGDYTQLHVAPEQFAFIRQCEGSAALAAVNASGKPITLDLPAPLADGARLTDALNGDAFTVKGGRVKMELPPNWGRILKY